MDNLRVDVLLETERRSTSPVSLKFLARIVGGAAASIVAVVIVVLFIKAHQAKKELGALQTEWAKTEKQHLKVQKYQTAFRNDKAILDEIEGWRACRMSWREQLDAFQQIVPDTIQLTALRIGESLQLVGNTAALLFSMDIAGRARGSSPRQDVSNLERRLLRSPGFVEVVESAEVRPGSFTKDPAPDAEPHHRVFAIGVKFKPREFVSETAGR